MNIVPYDKADMVTNYGFESYAHIPNPSLNGGLYTGEAFDQNAKYKNFPSMADSLYLHTVNLKSANPPPGVQYQYPDNLRPGNNMPLTNVMNLSRFSDTHAILCTQANKLVEK